MEQKTVFISYRRAISKHLARSIYQNLKMNDWDAFLDVNTIDSGDFDRIILNQIAARAHFILVISPDSLARCANEGDWVLREIEEALRLGRNIVPIVEEGASLTQELAYLPATLGTILGKKNALPLPHFFFDAAMDMLRNRFLKAPEYIRLQATPVAEQAEVQRRIESLDKPKPKPTAKSLLPAPFGWCAIPAGKVALESGGYLKEKTTFDVPAFEMAKYPVTNAQYAKFIEAGCYKTKDWWTNDGWKVCQEGWHYDGGWKASGKAWTEPRYWQDAKFNGANQPVVGVSWYEGVAFCTWLSSVTGDTIMLPTEQEWQRTAQAKADGGNTECVYVWGNDWDGKKCNNSVSPEKNKQTSLVTHYKKLGNVSPCGVVDLIGNVWEWCLTQYQTGKTGINGTDVRLLRGGAWDDNDTYNFCVGYRYRFNPSYWYNYVGFRFSRS